MKLCYLASPYSADRQETMDYREEEVTRAAAILTNRYGHALFLPITQSAAMKRYVPELGTSFEAWKGIDLFLVASKADEVWVLMLPGWNKSIGVLAEIETAIAHNVPVKYITPELDFVEVDSADFKRCL